MCLRGGECFTGLVHGASAVLMCAECGVGTFQRSSKFDGYATVSGDAGVVHRGREMLIGARMG